jgi:hypothetical protein
MENLSSEKKAFFANYSEEGSRIFANANAMSFFTPNLKPRGWGWCFCVETIDKV